MFLFRIVAEPFQGVKRPQKALLPWFAKDRAGGYEPAPEPVDKSR